ncbi:thiol reductant ABC exporter subunit CydD [Pseudoduganella umbonata]|uniref:ATP-binding cassette subfamily C protein CydD n=1 Tax=Pseudoduganella umbonata TaxID=864828 RepID=A0A4P8HIE8_9BURK|nr:thiol reductant ABC exporter subunit CydD [Pseudoduganella umbonata]MBB3225156.1 ATP-binding cassette subfamily C protein CydD [Pseudoduganella umbonata]QCP09313.1 thiol reductant ABC exporter subunit CydD [Pseudoduganella umbonata]
MRISPNPVTARRPPPAAGSLRAALAIGAAPLLWIPQAALLAWAVQGLADGAGLATLASAAIAYLLLGLARASAEAWAARRLYTASRERVTVLRAAAARALAGRSPLDRGRLPSGAAASVLAEQAEAVLPWLVRYQPARWRAMLVLPAIALVVATQSWAAALILAGAAPLIPLFMAVIGWRARDASAAQLQLAGGMNGFLLDRLRGLSTLRALGAVDATATRLRATAEAVRAGTMRVLRIAFLSSTALELFSALGVALVAVYIGFHLLGQIDPGSWGHRLTLEQGLFILLLAPAFFEPLRELAAVWHDKAAGEAALAALDALHGDSMPLPGALAAPVAAPAGAVAVDVDDLHFAHAGEAPLFAGAALHIGAGEHVALVGPSGSGKTALLSLVAGLVPAAAGTVRIGGVALDGDSAAGLRARMAWIGQKPHVFAGTVRGNVSLERPGVTTAGVSAAIDRAGLGHVQHATPDDSLGEGGTGLSGGELVRLALARAAVLPQAGLLLADEPTAHLDRDTAAGVVDALLRLAEGRTLVVATHDLALARRIGRVIDIGALRGMREAA